MNPLMFADWRTIAHSFTILMWTVAVILAILVASPHSSHPSRPRPHPVGVMH